MMSTAEITPPRIPNRSVRGGSAGALPCPQSQIDDAFRCPSAARHVGRDFLIRDVVRGCCIHLLFAGPPDHQMAIADAGKKLDPIPSQFSRDVTDDRRGLFGRYVPGGEIFHEGFTTAAAQSYQIAAKGDVLRS